ncbi:MAG: polysaccharide deacetylase family protein [Bacteroidetes bacterium]|nr:polysaccharide deacetylase family protein [Bacteroidota bacterium]
MNILTFDIEEWFHLLDTNLSNTEESWEKFEVRIYKNMDRIFKLLDEKNIKATFFCLGWIAKKYPEIIKQIDQLGYEIGCHSDQHKLVNTLTPALFKKDTEIAVLRLEDIIGKKITSYRAPCFSFTPETSWAYEILAELGITHDSSIFPSLKILGGYENFPSEKACIVKYNGITMKELPITKASFLGQNIVYSGGGFFRFFPYYLIKYWSKNSDYLMTYLHPRDIDAMQPMIKELTFSRKFKSYYGLHTAEDKFNRWLTDFKFLDIREFDKKYDWEKAQIVNL